MRVFQAPYHNHIRKHLGKSIAVALLCTTLLTPALVLAAENAAAKAPRQTVGEPKIIVTKYEDTLPAIAEREQVGYAELLAANPKVDPLMPGAGTKLILPTMNLLPNTTQEGLVLNVGELRLYYYPKDGSEPRSFPIGIGREGLNTPMGTTTITRKAPNPTWRPTPRMLLENPELEPQMKGGDPENPLGKYALYMGWPSYLLHGTSKPKAVGRRASSGCIRMYAKDIEWLYNNVPVGTKVTSVNQPVKMAWIDGALFLEATPSDIQIDELEYQSQQKTISVDDGTVGKILNFAGNQSDRIDWHTARQVLINRTGIPTQITVGEPVKLSQVDLPEAQPEQTAVVLPPKKVVKKKAAPKQVPVSSAKLPSKYVGDTKVNKTRQRNRYAPSDTNFESLN